VYAKARAQFFGQDALKNVHSACFEEFFHSEKNRAKNKFLSNDSYKAL